MSEGPRRRVRLLPVGSPAWAELMVSALVGIAVGGTSAYLMVLLVMGGAIDGVGWAFVGAAALFGCLLGVWNASPERGRKALAAVGTALLVALLGYILVDRERLTYRRSSPRGPWIAVVGVCVLVAGGAAMTLSHLKRRPRDKWDVVLALLTAVVFGTGLVFAVLLLWDRYA